jgi:hypothetical protein
MLEIDPQTERRNMLFGLALFALALVLFAGTFVIAMIYLAVSG